MAFLGEIRAFPFNFVPNGWAICSGQLMPIAQNTALFSILGVQYGGDGKTSFALPDLRGNATIGMGQGPGLSDYAIGEAVGTPTVTLLGSEMPTHTHAPAVALGSGATMHDTPQSGDQLSRYAPTATTLGPAWNVSAASSTLMAFQMATPAGGSMPHENMQPFLTMQYCIALTGTYPPRP